MRSVSGSGVRTTLALASLALAAGCADIFGPPAEPTVFALRALDGESLPAVVATDPFNAFFLDADSLFVFANGAATWIRHTRWELDAGGPILGRLDSTVAIVRSGGEFTFTTPPTCSLMATCSDLTPTRLTRLPDEFILVSDGGARRYQRVSSAR